MEKLQRYLMENNLPCDDAIMQKFDKYFDMLIEWNSTKCNLTAITERGDVEVKHFIDSLLGARYIASGSTVVDLGAGAGFPSLPLAFIKEDVQFDMVDSLNKRILFLNHVIENMSINNATAHHSRAEDFIRGGKREHYDYAIARALAPLPILLEYLVPYVKVGGQIIAYKGDNYLPELENSSYALYMLGCELKHVDTVTLDGEFCRNIIVINKVKSCPIVYPRIGNRPRINPLVK